MRHDLSGGQGLPQWILSAYGPGQNPPRQLFGGPIREQSFEEMRLRHYIAAAMGDSGRAVQNAEQLYAQASNQTNIALADLKGAVQYVLDGANEHPNRSDSMANTSETRSFAQSNRRFRQSNNTGIGKPSPSFGQPSQAPAFGQPSSLGSTAFGKPSGFGQPSTFGQPSALNQSGGFGKPSGFGGQQPAVGQPTFGQPSFGQPSFGKPFFGQPSTSGPSLSGKPAVPSPFSQLGAQRPTGFALPFGPQRPQPAPAPGSFGQQTAGRFGQQPPGGFGTAGGFGQPSTAGPPVQQINPFGQPSGPSNTTAARGGPEPHELPVNNTQPGPPPLIKVDSPGELNPIPMMTGQTRRDPMSHRLSSWKGQQVQYINSNPCYLHPQDNKTWVRIFFPNGPPDDASLKHAHGKPEEYTAEVTEQYEFFLKNGAFKDNAIPSVPPKREWVSFDF